MRSNEPIRFGTAVSQNSSDSDSAMPTLPRLITTIVQSTQMLKPRFSAKIEKIRFLRAIRAARGRPERLVLGLPMIDPAAATKAGYGDGSCSWIAR